MSEKVQSAIITAVVGIGIVLVVRLVMRVAFAGYVDRVGGRRPEEVAGLRTRFTILQRLIVAILLVIVAWSVLSIFPTTSHLARGIFASGVVLTVFIGIALGGPLANIGAGVLIGLTQPIRLGDRITIGETTGTAAEITLIHTVLITDEGRRVFVPNSQMANSVVVNRSIEDPRRVVSVRLPIALRSSIERARQIILAAVAAVSDTENATLTDMSVVLGELTEHTAWLTLTAYAAAESDVGGLAGELRERALEALASEGLLPA